MKAYLKLFVLISVIASSAFLSCASMAASAEEYYNIGMAYFEFAQNSTGTKREEYFREAEKWFNRARQADKTMLASQYNLGRMAFEMGRYTEASEYFEDILVRDPDNVLALRAAAYSRIKSGDIELAQAHYERLLGLVPDSVDDGYNHALVLYAMEKYDRAEETLEKYPFALSDSSDVLLLYARSQKAQDKVEAINSYSKWMEFNSDVKIHYEYIQLLEQHEFFARAIEEYYLLLEETFTSASGIEKSDVRFSLASLLLRADSENSEGISELETAVSEGFKDIEAVEELLENESISSSNLTNIRIILADMRRKEGSDSQESDDDEDEGEDEEDGGSDDEDESEDDSQAGA